MRTAGAERKITNIGPGSTKCAARRPLKPMPLRPAANIAPPYAVIVLLSLRRYHAIATCSAIPLTHSLYTHSGAASTSSRWASCSSKAGQRPCSPTPFRCVCTRVMCIARARVCDRRHGLCARGTSVSASVL